MSPVVRGCRELFKWSYSERGREGGWEEMYRGHALAACVMSIFCGTVEISFPRELNLFYSEFSLL